MKRARFGLPDLHRQIVTLAGAKVVTYSLHFSHNA